MRPNQGSGHIGMGSEIGESALVQAAWLEWRTGIASVSGDPDECRPTLSPDAYPVDPPAWFRFEELGLAIEHGPSLRWTCTTLESSNRRSIVQLGREAPLRVTYPRSFADPRKNKTTTPRSRRSAYSQPIEADVRRGGTLSQQIDREIAAFKTRSAA